jgi:hypothetical protein
MINKLHDALFIATACITLILSGYVIAVGLMNILAAVTRC